MLVTRDFNSANLNILINEFKKDEIVTLNIATMNMAGSRMPVQAELIEAMAATKNLKTIHLEKVTPGVKLFFLKLIELREAYTKLPITIHPDVRRKSVKARLAATQIQDLPINEEGSDEMQLEDASLQNSSSSSAAAAQTETHPDLLNSAVEELQIPLFREPSLPDRLVIEYPQSTHEEKSIENELEELGAEELDSDVPEMLIETHSQDLVTPEEMADAEVMSFSDPEGEMVEAEQEIADAEEVLFSDAEEEMTEAEQGMANAAEAMLFIEPEEEKANVEAETMLAVSAGQADNACQNFAAQGGHCQCYANLFSRALTGMSTSAIVRERAQTQDPDTKPRVSNRLRRRKAV